MDVKGMVGIGSNVGRRACLTGRIFGSDIVGRKTWSSAVLCYVYLLCNDHINILK